MPSTEHDETLRVGIDLSKAKLETLNKGLHREGWTVTWRAQGKGLFFNLGPVVCTLNRGKQPMIICPQGQRDAVLNHLEWVYARELCEALAKYTAAVVTTITDAQTMFAYRVDLMGVEIFFSAICPTKGPMLVQIEIPPVSLEYLDMVEELLDKFCRACGGDRVTDLYMVGCSQPELVLNHA